jgi:hypothetical protein
MKIDSSPSSAIDSEFYRKDRINVLCDINGNCHEVVAKANTVASHNARTSVLRQVFR